MAAMTLTADGLLPIPEDVRESLGLRPGDRVELRLREDGIVELAPEQEHPRPYEAIADLIGCVRGGPPDLSERTGENFRELLTQRQKKP